ncbi:MAG: AMIN domain-containing protein [Gammaproteobacteria bacterium]|jgi:N-acetylmuramoyl-L-alanine amidase|nr:MAG: AMIN domain-containing protein [Gammaproteobacteria bacterium]
MRILKALTLGLLLAPGILLAQGVSVDNVRIWAAPDNTRIVFDVSAPVQYQLSLLEDPYRLVVDLREVRVKRQPAQPAPTDKFLQRLRGASDNGKDWRFVLDLKKYAQTKSFQLPPNEQYGHRLVVDVFNPEVELSPPDAPLEVEQGPDRSREIVIAVDAGHGGEDPGSIGPSGTYEKDVIYKVADRLTAMINREPGMRAVMVREGDYFIPLRKRIQKARDHKADLFISIHADAFRDRRVNGASVYVLSQKGASSEYARWLAARENASDLIGGVSLDDKDDVLASVLLDLSQTASLEESIEIAEEVLGGLREVGKLHKSRVEAAGFAVLKSPDIPSILVETAYLSNPAEEKKLRNPEQQQKIAASIMKGVRNYFRSNRPEGMQLALRKHVITKGDTLSEIAESYQVSVQHLREYNNLKNDVVRTGQVLEIPTSGG